MKILYFIKILLIIVSFVNNISVYAAPPVEVIGDVALPGVVVSVTDSQKSIKNKATQNQNNKNEDSLYEETRISLTVESGVTDLVPIARNYLNRIITPFDDPKVITVNPIEFQKEGSSIFVTSASKKPVGIHILPNDPQDSRSISLALVPKAIPPRTIRLKWSGDVTDASFRKAKVWEESSDYVGTLINLLTETATGIPTGYALIETSDGITCELPDVDFVIGQRLKGSHFSVYILLATNTSNRVIEIQGNAGCYHPQLKAVAPWPQAHIAPNESTEIYVVVSNDAAGSDRNKRLRPSLLRVVR